MSKPYKLVNADFQEYSDHVFTTITVKKEFANMSKEEFQKLFPEEWKEMKLKAFDIIVNELKVMASEDACVLSDLISDVTGTGKWEYAQEPEKNPEEDPIE